MLNSHNYNSGFCAIALASSLALPAFAEYGHGFEARAFGAEGPIAARLLPKAADAAATPQRKGDLTAHQGAVLLGARAIEMTDATYRSIKSGKVL